MTVWRITGRCFAHPPPVDWREQLALRLGERPRRMGAWAELALYGARCCLDAANEATLPGNALLSLASLHGPDIALRSALDQAQDEALMPLTFLSSQPSQVLPALALHLGWQGHGRCLTTRDPCLALYMACLEAGSGGLLIGWVEEDFAGQSNWLRLVPVDTTQGDTSAIHAATFHAATFSEITNKNTQWQLLTFIKQQLHLA